MNRIKDAKEMIGSTQEWKQTFQYDRFGNRRFDTSNGNTTTLIANCETPICNPEISATNNRLIGTTFDNAGNTTVDASGQTFVYDAENKQVKVTNAGGINKYFYDGDGKRVKKEVPSTGETTIFVYDASGKTVAEYSTNVEPQTSAKISYLTNDHLGSPRITTNANGTVISRRDFMPFGEEISRAGYSADSVRQKFTSYERDAETDLDFAQARMYSKNHGRFNSVDPIMMKKSRQLDPQRINLYAYVRNNPLKYKDVNGEDLVLATKDANEQKIIKQALVEIAKTESGRKFLQTLEDSKATYELSINNNIKDTNGNSAYGRNRTDPNLAGTNGKTEEGTVIIQINPNLIKADNDKNKEREKENKKTEENNKAIRQVNKETGSKIPENPTKRVLIEDVPANNAAALTNELVQSTNVINGGARDQTSGEQTGTIPTSQKILSDPNKAKGDATKFVEEVLKPKQ